MHKFEEKVLNTIKKYDLLNEDESIVVGVSGGADSMALLTSLICLGYKCIAVHINHSLRGKDADDDQKHVERFCLDNDIKCYSQSFDVAKISKEQKISLEMAGRNVRYNFFNEVLNKTSCKKIAVAHNKSDSVETTVFNMIRGAAISGLKGISARNGNIIRPLIECEREEIIDYLDFKSIEFKIDKTNLCNDYTRNKIRNQIIPLMKEINPSVIDTIYSNSKIIEEENDFINDSVNEYIIKYVKENNGEIYLDTACFCKISNAIKSRLIIYCIKKAVNKHVELSKKHIEMIINLASGKKFYFENNGLTIINNYGILHFNVALNKIEDFSYLLCDENGNLANDNTIPFITEYISYKQIKNFNDATYICIDNINLPIYVRNRKKGDKIELLNVGTKKVKDIFIDKKIPKDFRDRIPIIATNDNVLAVYGLNVSKKSMVYKDSQKILMIKTKD